MTCHRSLIRVVAGLAAMAALGGCARTEVPTAAPSGSIAPEEDAGPAQPGGALTVAVAAETDSFNPYGGAWLTATYTVANALFDPLVSIDSGGAAQPYLAESIVPDREFRTWTITTRPEVTFHDGTPVDAAAIKQNLETGKRSGLTSQAFAPVESVTATDARTVVVTMNRPWSTFAVALSTQAGYMIAPSMLDDPAGAEAKIVGSGPFTFQERQRGSYLKAVRNPRYWKKSPRGEQLPYLDAIQFKVITDPAARQSSFRAGDIDASQLSTASDVTFANDLGTKGEVHVLSDTRAESNEGVLTFNTSKEPFDDPTARQAVAYAIDRDDLMQTAYQGAFPAAWGMFEEGSPFYISAQQAGSPTHDLAKAKQLAGDYEQRHNKPLEFSLLGVADIDDLAAAQAIQAQLAEAGIKANIESVDLATRTNRVVVAGTYQASTILLWSAPSPDQSYVFLGTPANPNGLSLNYSRFDDPDLTAALDSFRSTSDTNKQKEAMTTVQRELAKNLQVLFLYHFRTGFLYATRVHGITANTFPGTDVGATSPYASTPFYTNAWIKR